MTDAPRVTVRALRLNSGAWQDTERAVPEETPVAIVIDGGAEAVMMATPADLEDFAAGFALTEGIVATLDAIDRLEIAPAERGIEARLWLKPGARSDHAQRKRRRAGPVGCGLCGVEGIDDALPALQPVVSDARFAARDILEAMAALPAAQKLFQQTRAVHAAGFYRPGQGVMLVREDVGRHNALDKLVGALARNGQDASDGVILMTSRVSVELIQKAARIGAPVLAAVSAPTALALRLAESANISVCGIVRGASLEVFTQPQRIMRDHAD